MSGQSFPQDVVAGTQLVIPSIHSPNYLTGVSGWTINLDGSAEFDNLTIRGTFSGSDFVINSSGAFFYSGAPANGNLIISIASSAGTDTFGNTYPQGIFVAKGSISGGVISSASISGDSVIFGNIIQDHLATGVLDNYTANNFTINSGNIKTSNVIVSGTMGGVFIYGTGGTITQTFTGSGNWTAPPGVSSVYVVAIGPGAAGAAIGTNTGGGGGEFAAESALAVTAGHSYAYANTGGNVTFAGDSVTVTAHAASGTSGGTGSSNSIHHNGGNGGANGDPNDTFGGGGGGSGGATGAGGNGQASNIGGGGSGGTGGSGTGSPTSPMGGYGGSGGEGGRGSDGAPPGGGGGGPLGAGGSGYLLIQYTSTSPNLVAAGVGAATTDPITSTSLLEGVTSDHLNLTTVTSTPATPSGQCILYYKGGSLFAVGPSGTPVNIATT